MHHDLFHSDGPIVVKLGGAVLTDEVALAALASSMAQFNKSHPGRLVVVHGGGSIADAKLAGAGFAPTKHEGLRCTPPEAIGLIVEAFKANANSALVSAMHAAGLKPVGLTLSDLGSLLIDKKTLPGVDLGRVGTPRPGNPFLLKSILASEHTPVHCSIGLGSDSRWLNVNADEAAGSLAATLRASAVLLLSDVPAVLDADGDPVACLDEHTITDLVERGVIEGGMIPKVLAALHAAQASGCPALISSWTGSDPIGGPLRGRSVCTRVVSSKHGVLS